MEKSIPGIVNLSKTYKYDIETVKKLEKIIINITTMITNFKNIYSTNYTL